MKQISAFKKIVKQLHHHQRGLKKPRVMHPARDWWLGIMIALVLFFAASAWSAHTYHSYSHLNGGSADADSSQPVVYRAAVVASALELFAERANVHESHKESIRSGVLQSQPVLPAEPTQPKSSTSTPGTSLTDPKEERDATDPTVNPADTQVADEAQTEPTIEPTLDGF